LEGGIIPLVNCCLGRFVIGIFLVLWIWLQRRRSF